MTETLVVRELAVRGLDHQIEQPQPTSDFEIAKISAWCRKHGYTYHVSLEGKREFRKKSSALPPAVAM